ncbi:hypothetical protein K3495_g13029 [Podosphaera aphanis]|nr:hypothetical protein K3495_g13029 [Podosphaera aphanis]
MQGLGSPKFLHLQGYHIIDFQYPSSPVSAKILDYRSLAFRQVQLYYTQPNSGPPGHKSSSASTATNGVILRLPVTRRRDIVSLPTPTRPEIALRRLCRAVTAARHTSHGKKGRVQISRHLKLVSVQRAKFELLEQMAEIRRTETTTTVASVASKKLEGFKRSLGYPRKEVLAPIATATTEGRYVTSVTIINLNKIHLTSF